MRPAISSEKISDTLTISLCHADSEHRIEPNYWLYDKTRGMNLAMGAETKEAAYLEALQYYQNRLMDVELKYKILTDKVNGFLSQFPEED